ncbi:MAG: hypothetical protein ACTS4Z_00100 [Candidatus Hodgkinia cicadicola]
MDQVEDVELVELIELPLRELLTTYNIPVIKFLLQKAPLLRFWKTDKCDWYDSLFNLMNVVDKSFMLIEDSFL